MARNNKNYRPRGGKNLGTASPEEFESVGEDFYGTNWRICFEDDKIVIEIEGEMGELIFGEDQSTRFGEAFNKARKLQRGA
jgi:hypothetical protein